MKTLSNIQFPETREEAATWEPRVTYRALHSEVLVVARMRIEGTWKAYCGPVSGQNHDNELEDVLATGSDVGEAVARILFPHFSEIPYAR